METEGRNSEVNLQELNASLPAWVQYANNSTTAAPVLRESSYTE